MRYVTEYDIVIAETRYELVSKINAKLRQTDPAQDYYETCWGLRGEVTITKGSNSLMYAQALTRVVKIED